MLMTLDPPYRLQTEDMRFRFRGWAQVTDPATPDIGLAINGVPVPVTLTEQPPRLAEFYPGVEAWRFIAEVDFREVLSRATAVAEPFLLEATVTTEGHARTFEYAVTDAWLQVVFDRPMRARPMPPEHLQVRVAGAAAGEFHATGREAARRIADLLARCGRPLQGARTILDFGCGPGRLATCIHERHPGARIDACDIDPEAIAWAQAALPDVARFHATGARPPLPFASRSFDLIYGISVFTHLPEDLQYAWLSELRRVLKPGGLLLTTKMNHAAYDLPDRVKADGATGGFAYWDDAQATEGLPDFYRLAYHSHDYVRREWGKGFDVIHVGAHDLNGTQDSVVLRRPPSPFGLPALPSFRRRAQPAETAPAQGDGLRF